MATYRRVCDSRHRQADCKEPGSPSEPYARQSSMGYLFNYFSVMRRTQLHTKAELQTVETSDETKFDYTAYIGRLHRDLCV